MKMQHRIVTILLLAWVAMFAVSGFSQVFTAAGTTGPIDQTNSGIYNHRLTWTGAGTRTTCTVKLEQSIDGVTWTDLIAAQVCTTNGTATATGYANYVRMNVTALAGAGNTVYPRYDGTPVAATVGAVTIAPGSTVTSDQGAVGANAWKVVGTGTAGTPGTAVLTVQGIGSGTAVPVSGTFTNTALSTAQAADIAGVTGPLVQASTLTTGSNPAYTTAKVNPLSISTIGGLRMEGVGAAGTAAGGVVSIQGAAGATAVPISGTVTATSTGTDDITKLGGVSIVAAGDAVVGKPLPVTGKAVATQPAVVDAGDANFLSTTTDGRLIIKEAAPPQDEWQYTAVITDGNEFTVKAGEANYYLVVTAVLVINSHASVGTVVTFKNATGGTAIYQGYAASGGGGWSQGNGVGSLFIVPTAGNGLFGICATTGSATAVNIRGYKTKVAP